MSKQLNHSGSWGFYNPNPAGTNESMNMNDWSQVEFQNFVKWFIEVNYPDAVEQYQAVRAIERHAEKAAELEHEIRMAELRKNYTQNAYQNPQSMYYGMSVTVDEDTKTKSFWERCKELARRPLGHGDYY